MSSTSYLLPEKLYAYMASWFASSFRASVSWISPPLPGFVFSSILNILGLIIYLPNIAIFDGASSTLGFSIKPFTLYTLSSIYFPLCILRKHLNYSIA